MPIYSYVCSCGNAEDTLQAINEAPPKCKKCKKKMKRTFAGGTVGLQFKGGGFHKTDYPSYGGTKGNPVMTVRNKSRDSKDRRAKPRSVKGVEDRLR